MSESAYETMLAAELINSGHDVRRQVAVPLMYQNQRVGSAFKIDLLVDELIVVEIKVVKAIGLHHIRQVVTYLKAANLPLGLILNFGAPSMRYGIKRIINSPRQAVDFASESLP